MRAARSAENVDGGRGPTTIAQTGWRPGAWRLKRRNNAGLMSPPELQVWILMCSSRSCFASTGDGADAIRSSALAGPSGTQ